MYRFVSHSGMQTTKKTLITTTTTTSTKAFQRRQHNSISGWIERNRDSYNGAHTQTNKNGNRQASNTWSDSVTTIELIGMVLNQLLRNKLCRFIAAKQDENHISFGSFMRNGLQ